MNTRMNKMINLIDEYFEELYFVSSIQAVASCNETYLNLTALHIYSRYQTEGTVWDD